MGDESNVASGASLDLSAGVVPARELAAQQTAPAESVVEETDVLEVEPEIVTTPVTDDEPPVEPDTTDDEATADE